MNFWISYKNPHMRKQPQFWLWRKIACRIPESIRRYWTSRWQKIGQKKYNFLNDLAKAPDVLLEFMLSSLLHLNSSELHFGQSEFKAPHGENKNDNMTYLIGLLYRLTVIMVVKFLVYLKCSINIIIGEGNGTHSSTLAWKIPWMEEPGGLQSMGALKSDKTQRLHSHFSLSSIGEGNGNPLQCSCLETPRDGRASWAAVYGVAESRTRLKQLSSSSKYYYCWCCCCCCHCCYYEDIMFEVLIIRIFIINLIIANYIF